MSSTLIA